MDLYTSQISIALINHLAIRFLGSYPLSAREGISELCDRVSHEKINVNQLVEAIESYIASKWQEARRNGKTEDMKAFTRLEDRLMIELNLISAQQVSDRNSWVKGDLVWIPLEEDEE